MVMMFMRTGKQLFILVCVGCIALVTRGATLYNDTSDVIKLASMADYDLVVNQGSGVCALQFYNDDEACEPCRAYEERYKKLASLVKGLFKIAVIDVATDFGNDVAVQWGVNHLPYVVVVGDNKTLAMAIDPPHLFEELMLAASKTIQDRAERILGVRSEAEINEKFRQGGAQSESLKAVKKPKVTRLVIDVESEDFNDVVLGTKDIVVAAFIHPACEKSRKLRRQFEEAASRLVGESAKAVWIDLTKLPEMSERFNIKHTPTILIFPGGEKSMDKVYAYKGDRVGNEIAIAVFREVDKTGRRKQVIQLTGPDILQKYCAGINHVCVMGVLPPLLETGAEGRNKYIALLERLQTVFRGSSYSFLWFEAGTQPGIEKAMHLNFGFPALATYTLDRNAYSTMLGSFSDKGISTYLHAIASGRTSVQPLFSPFQVSTIEPWDGEDAVGIFPLLDEIPLSEIMEHLKDESCEGEENCTKENAKEEAQPAEKDEEDDEDFFREEL